MDYRSIVLQQEVSVDREELRIQLAFAPLFLLQRTHRAVSFIGRACVIDTVSRMVNDLFLYVQPTAVTWT